MKISSYALRTDPHIIPYVWLIQGWESGKGLGAKGTGITEPIKADSRETKDGKRGVGSGNSPPSLTTSPTADLQVPNRF